MKWKGDEFQPNEIAICDSGVSTCEVEVLQWSKEFGGWWYIKLPNGCYHYTKRLTQLNKFEEA